MKKSVLAVILGVIALLAIGSVVALNNRNNRAQPVANNSNTSESANDDNSGSSNTNSGSSNDQSVSNEDIHKDAVEVEIDDFAFKQATVTIKKGTTVTWTNKDEVGHTVTSDDDAPADKLDSKVLAKGESYSVTFNNAGTYNYHCTPHPHMTGKVVVTE